MNNIIVDTDNLRSIIEDLSSIEKYMSKKKITFSSNKTNSIDINKIIYSISNNYENLCNDIDTLLESLKTYIKDIENLEYNTCNKELKKIEDVKIDIKDPFAN